jgi:hypothetical protein
MVWGWVPGIIAAGLGLGINQGNEERREATRLKERREDQLERQAARERAENAPPKPGSDAWLEREIKANNNGRERLWPRK